MDESVEPRPSSRRGFLTGAAGAAVGAGVLGALSASGTAATPAPRERTARYVHPRIDPPRPAHPVYRRSLFENARGGRVVVGLEGGPVTLSIRDVEPLDVARDAKAGTREWQNAFRVTLVGPPGVDIPQGTHRVNVDGRSFDLFVVPVMRYGERPVYEAIINRAYYRRMNG